MCYSKKEIRNHRGVSGYSSVETLWGRDLRSWNSSLWSKWTGQFVLLATVFGIRVIEMTLHMWDRMKNRVMCFYFRTYCCCVPVLLGSSQPGHPCPLCWKYQPYKNLGCQPAPQGSAHRNELIFYLKKVAFIYNKNHLHAQYSLSVMYLLYMHVSIMGSLDHPCVI